MLFTHDTDVALAAAAALVNTMPGSVPGDDAPDRLTTPDELDALFHEQGWTGRFDRGAGELARLRVCEAADCDDVVVDLSRNRSRRFCEGGCAARAHTAAYRARRAARA